MHCNLKKMAYELQNGDHNTSNVDLLLVGIKGMKSIGELAKIK